MKNIIVIMTVICFCITTRVLGQQNKFDIGLESGPSLISLRGNEIIEKYYKPGVGFSAGLFFQYNLPKYISVRTGLSFERKGGVGKGTYTDVSGNTGKFTTHSNFDYLTVPILVRASFGKRMKLFFNAGPSFSYLIKQTFVSEDSNFPRTTMDYTDLYKPFNLGVITGLGASIPLKENFSVSLEIRNNLGINNVSDLSVYKAGFIKTNSTDLLVGITYKLGQRK